MTLDQQVGSLWQKIALPQKAAFFSCLITGYLVHLFAFTNIVPNADGLSRVFDLQQMTVSGRWFLHYASYLNGFTQMPTVIGFLSLLFLGLAAALITKVLRFRSGVLGAITGAVMAAFPCLGYTFLYLFTASSYCLAIFLGVLSVTLARRSWKALPLGILLLALSMGIYQAYAAVAVTLSLLVIFREAIDSEAKLRDAGLLTLRLVLNLTLGAVLYYGILQIFLKGKGLELLSYLGMDSAASGYPLRSLPSLIVKVYKQILSFFWKPGTGFTNRALATLNLLILAGGICSFFLGREKGFWKTGWRLAASLGVLLLLPIGMGFAQLVSPYSNATPIMKYAYVGFYLLVLLLLDSCPLKAVSWQKTVRPLGTLMLSGLLLLSFLNINNLLYTASAQAHRATESYITRLMARIEDCPDYEPGMEVVIIGAIPTDEIYSSIESYNRITHYSVPIDTVAPLNKHIYYYLNDWLNVPIAEPSEETMIAVSNSPQFQAMPLYPAQGSIQVIDGRLVVRIRETYTPKKDYELAYENRK